MKKVFMTLAAIAAFSFANAQVFVGGSLGFSSQSSSVDLTLSEGNTVIHANDIRDEEYVDPATSEFYFAPKVGIYLTDKLAAGLSLGFGRYTETEYSMYDINTNANPATFKEEVYKSIYTDFAVAPFVRYHFAGWNNFSVFAELTAGVMFGNEKSIAERGTTREEDNNQKSFGLGVAVVPGLAYKINENIQLEATLDLFGLNYNYTKFTYEDGDEYKAENKESEFGLGIDTESVFNVGSLTIGFTYKF